MTLIYHWSMDPTWTGGPRLGELTRLAMLESEVAQGLVGGLTLPADRLNWYIGQIADELRSRTFGRAADGDAVISGGTTQIVRDMQYNTLTVAADGILSTRGHRVFVRGDCTIRGLLRVSPGSPSPSLYGGNPRVPGVGAGAGADGGGTLALGGDGGDGGLSTGGNGGAGGVAAKPALGRLAEVLTCSTLEAGAFVGLRGGASGGSGAGSGGGTSGTGGEGGGIVLLAAEHVIWDGGTIAAAGESGGTVLVGSGAGGGGGGGGGAVIVVYGRMSGVPAYDVSGGAGSSGDLPGVAGQNGSAGQVYTFSV